MATTATPSNSLSTTSRRAAAIKDRARRLDRRIYMPIYLSSFVVVNAVVIAYSTIIG